MGCADLSPESYAHPADPAVFAPSELKVGHWARVAAEGGFDRVVLTTKHHGWFCLWPSALTDYSVAASP